MPAITDAIVKLSLSDLTTGVPTGAGAFDGLMRSVKAHLMEEFNAGRITGGEYTKAYIALVQVAMTNALQFLLSKEQTYWTSVTAQKNVETVQYNLDNLLPAQLAMTQSQKLGQDKANSISDYTLATKLPAEVAMLNSQKAGVEKSTEIAAYTLTNLNPAQLKLLQEQKEVQRAQTLDTREDGAIVAGSVKSQKDLYAQQVTSYQRSSQLNAAKVFVDAFTAESALTDGGGTAPTAIGTSNIQTVLTALQSANGL